MKKSPNLAKTTAVTDLSAKIGKSKVVVLTDYTGLTVFQANELRTKIQEAGGIFQVTKNTLLRLALPVSVHDSLKAHLQGPTAVLLAITDESTPLKALIQFAKSHSIPKPKIGLMGDRVLSVAEINTLATLPSRELLLGRLLGTLNSPVTSLAFVLQGNTRKLLYALNQIAKAKTN